MSEASKSPRVAALEQSLREEEKALEDRLKTAREFYEQHVNDPKFLEAKRTIREVSAALVPVKNELAAIARSNPGTKSLKAEAGIYAKE